MFWEVALLSSGIALQLFGVALTIHGARTVWRHVKSSDDRFLAPLIQAGRWVGRQLQRLLRLPGPTQTLRPNSVRSTAKVGRPRLRQFPPPLAADLTVEQALQELDDRLRQVQRLAYDQVDAAETRVRETVEQVRTEHQEAAAVAEQQAEQDRRTTIQGLRLEAYGFLFLTFGTLVQAGGSYFGIFSDPR